MALSASRATAHHGVQRTALPLGSCQLVDISSCANCNANCQDYTVAQMLGSWQASACLATRAVAGPVLSHLWQVQEAADQAVQLALGQMHLPDPEQDGPTPPASTTLAAAAQKQQLAQRAAAFLQAAKVSALHP